MKTVILIVVAIVVLNASLLRRGRPRRAAVNEVIFVCALLVVLPALANDLSSIPYVDYQRCTGDASKSKEQCLNEFVEETKALLIEDFKDPSSVQWRHLFVSSGEEEGPAPKVLCGEVNGKNSYGAYVGFRRFYSAYLGLTQVENEESHIQFNGMWQINCEHKIADVK